jgi:glucose/arabinose dehydrogenase
LIQGIGRIRDVEVDAQGRILLLSENAAGSKIVRMSPAK